MSSIKQILDVSTQYICYYKHEQGMRLQFMPVTDLSRVCKELKITFTFYLIFGSLYGFPFYKNFDTLLCTVSFNWLSKLRAAQTLKRALKTQCRRMFGITHPSSFGFKNKFFFSELRWRTSWCHTLCKTKRNLYTSNFAIFTVTVFFQRKLDYFRELFE